MKEVIKSLPMPDGMRNRLRETYYAAQRIVEVAGNILNGYISYIRLQKPVVKLFGPRVKRSTDYIEIDLTYACTLACYNCNRSVRQAPSGDHLSFEQIKKYVNESIEKGVKWRRIRLLGGEPIAHKHILEIMNLLLEYKGKHCPGVTIELHTNGYGKRVNKILPQVPENIVIVNTEKTGDINLFYPFNVAPVDLKAYRFADYSVGCRVPRDCGLGLTPYGYYVCACAGGIDRIVGLNLGRQELPEDDDDMIEQKEKLCRYCGSFRRGGYHFGHRVDYEVESPTWRNLYAAWREKRPKLTTY